MFYLYATMIVFYVQLYPVLQLFRSKLLISKNKQIKDISYIHIWSMNQWVKIDTWNWAERARERQRQRERQRETDRQTQTHTQKKERRRDTDRQTDTDRESETQRDSHVQASLKGTIKIEKYVVSPDATRNKTTAVWMEDSIVCWSSWNGNIIIWL